MATNYIHHTVIGLRPGEWGSRNGAREWGCGPVWGGGGMIGTAARWRDLRWLEVEVGAAPEIEGRRLHRKAGVVVVGMWGEDGAAGDSRRRGRRNNGGADFFHLRGPGDARIQWRRERAV
jgi:hypothetical protein